MTNGTFIKPIYGGYLIHNVLLITTIQYDKTFSEQLLMLSCAQQLQFGGIPKLSLLYILFNSGVFPNFHFQKMSHVILEYSQLSLPENVSCNSEVFPTFTFRKCPM